MVLTLKAVSPVQGLDEALQARAQENHDLLLSEGKVLLNDQIIEVRKARRAVRLKILGDLWRSLEALFVISIIAGFGYAIHLLIGLFLQ